LRQRSVKPEREQIAPLLVSGSFDRPETISFRDLDRLCAAAHIEEFFEPCLVGRFRPTGGPLHKLGRVTEMQIVEGLSEKI
jgi:hypothetical protein